MMTKSTGVHECLQPGLKNSGTDGRKHWMLNTLRPRQNGCYFPDIIFKCMFLNENVWIPIKISLKFALKGPINNILALDGAKPLSEPVLVCLLTHICVYRPQWVKCFGGDKGVVSSMVMCLFSANQCGCSDPLTSINVAAQIPWNQSMWLLRSPDINQCGCSDPLTSINVAAQIPWYQSMWLLRSPDINQCGCSDPLTSINVAAQIPWHQSMWLLRSPDINQCGCSDPLTYLCLIGELQEVPHSASMMMHICGTIRGNELTKVVWVAWQCACFPPINVAAQIPWHQSMWLLRSPDINQCGCSDPLTSSNVAAQIPWHISVWLGNYRKFLTLHQWWCIYAAL